MCRFVVSHSVVQFFPRPCIGRHLTDDDRPENKQLRYAITRNAHLGNQLHSLRCAFPRSLSQIARRYIYIFDKNRRSRLRDNVRAPLTPHIHNTRIYLHFVPPLSNICHAPLSLIFFFFLILLSPSFLYSFSLSFSLSIVLSPYRLYISSHFFFFVCANKAK